MARTQEAPRWTSQFREIGIQVEGRLHNLRWDGKRHVALLHPKDYRAGQAFGKRLRAVESNGLVYPSVRSSGGECVGLFFPDLAAHPIQGRHFDYHWDGRRVDLYREAGSGEVFRIL